MPATTAVFHHVEERPVAVAQAVPAGEARLLRRVLDAGADRDRDPGSRRVGGAEVGLTPRVGAEHEAGPAEVRRELLSEAHGRGVAPDPDVLGLELHVPGLGQVEEHDLQEDGEGQQGGNALEHWSLLLARQFLHCRLWLLRVSL